jgi:hypothetical protein
MPRDLRRSLPHHLNTEISAVFRLRHLVGK